MVNDLSVSELAQDKRRDLVRRLNDAKRPEQALGAEYELLVLWMLRESGELEIEPEWCAGNSRPDGYSEGTFMDGRGEIFEVTAISDGRMKEEDSMRAASQRLVEAANKIKKGSGRNLYFNYLEEWESIEGRRVRVRQIPSDLKITPYIEWGITELLRKTDERPVVRLKEGGLDVAIERKAQKQNALFNFHSSVPAEAKSLTDNPIYETLQRKRIQLRGASDDCRKVIWLCDGGADLLLACGKQRLGTRGITAEQIIENFLNQYPEIDLVCVLSAQHSEHFLGRREEKWWQLTLLATEDVRPLVNEAFLNRIVSNLPKPRFSGYQARELVLQRAYAPQAIGWYSGVSYRSVNNEGSIEVSARLVIDLLARRITPQQFSYFMGDRDGENIFSRLLDTGITFSDVKFVSGGLDDDDDKIVLHYSKDPAASDFA
ncbi:MAG: hypothetical protein ABS76_37605 [Pelagibacterium sp. SCN 64-44]|nr:MAG: hypothetical protein ABS76_37605 [Pelagibacterium sp. SCN 64-44]